MQPIIIILAALLLSSPALAQQPPRTNSSADICKQLLAEADGRIIDFAGEIGRLTARVKELEAKIVVPPAAKGKSTK